MTNPEHKEQVISKIQCTEDQDLLELILGILDQDIRSNEAYQLNERQNQRIDVALSQVEKGETYTTFEADKITRDCLEQ